MGNRKTSYPISKRLYYRSGRSNNNVSNGAQSDIADEMDTDTEVSLLKYRSMSMTSLDKDEGTCRSKIKSVTQLSSLEEKMGKIELSLGMKKLDRKSKNGSNFDPNLNGIKIINNVDENYRRALDQKMHHLQNSIEWQKNNIRKRKISTRNEKDRREDELKLLLDIQELDSLRKLASNTSSHVKNLNGLDLFSCIRGFEYVSLHAVDVLSYSLQNPIFEVEEKFDRRGLWIQWARKDLPIEKNDRIIEINGIFFIGKDHNDFIEITKNTSILHLVILRTKILPPQTVNFLTSMSTDREVYDLKTEIEKLKMAASQTNMLKEYLQDENGQLTKRLSKLEDQMAVLIDMLKKGLAFKKNSSILLNSLLIKNHTETAREKNSGYFSDYVNYKEKNKKAF